MDLLLRRDQRKGLLGKIVFALDVRASISDAERENIRRYKLGDTQLYASHEISGGFGMLGLASRLAYKAIALTITVDDLANGKKVECKDIVEMLAIEEHLTEAAKLFAAVLHAAANFGGEEVVPL